MGVQGVAMGALAPLTASRRRAAATRDRAAASRRVDAPLAEHLARVRNLPTLSFTGLRLVLELFDLHRVFREASINL